MDMETAVAFLAHQDWDTRNWLVAVIPHQV